MLVRQGRQPTRQPDQCSRAQGRADPRAPCVRHWITTIIRASRQHGSGRPRHASQQGAPGVAGGVAGAGRAAAGGGRGGRGGHQGACDEAIERSCAPGWAWACILAHTRPVFGHQRGWPASGQPLSGSPTARDCACHGSLHAACLPTDARLATPRPPVREPQPEARLGWWRCRAPKSSPARACPSLPTRWTPSPPSSSPPPRCRSACPTSSARMARSPAQAVRSARCPATAMGVIISAGTAHRRVLARRGRFFSRVKTARQPGADTTAAISEAAAPAGRWARSCPRSARWTPARPQPAG